jgi:Flp pilus assembly pilin Flp
MNQRVHRLLAEEQGADLIEYALLAALISLGAALSLTSVGSSLTSLFGSIDMKVAEINVQ